MNTKLPPVLCDANIVIKLFALDQWKNLIEKAEIVLASTIVSTEAHFYTVDEKRTEIDLTPDIASKRILVECASIAEMRALKARFRPNYLERLDLGETESLAILARNGNCFQICSADTIVWKVLGAMKVPERGISLEELFKRVGLSRKLEAMYGMDTRKNATQRGFMDGFNGVAMR